LAFQPCIPEILVSDHFLYTEIRKRLIKNNHKTCLSINYDGLLPATVSDSKYQESPHTLFRDIVINQERILKTLNK